MGLRLLGLRKSGTQSLKPINETKTGRVVVRAPKSQTWRTTIVVSQPGSRGTRRVFEAQLAD
jgi:hypothetical protein